MAFPAQIGTPSQGQFSAASVSPADATGYSAGDALLAVVAQDGTGTLTTTSTGWVKRGQVTHAGSTLTLAVFYKKSAAGSGSDALVVSSTVNERGTYIVQPISGGDSSIDAYISTGVFASTTDLDTDNLAPGVGAKDFLWITLGGGGGTAVPTAPPTNYTGMVTQTPLSSACSSYMAFRQLNAASEDPGVFTGTDQGNLGFTVAIAPPAGGPATVLGTAALDTSAALVATGKRTVLGSAALASSPDLAATGKRTVLGSAALASSASLTASGYSAITDQLAYKSLRVNAYLSSGAFTTQFNEAVANGAQHVRFSAQWDLVETSNGTFVWTKLDQAVNACVAAGIKCTLHIIKTPAWVGTADQWDPPIHNGTQITHWRDWITQLVTRYGTDIDIYEIWNEPNGATFNHSPSAQSAWPGEYADLMRNACEAAKAVDPDVKIGGMVTNRSLVSGFMEEVYDALEADVGIPTCQANNYYYDYLSLHPYCLTHAPGFAAGGDDIADAWSGDIGRSFNDFTRARQIVIDREGRPKPVYFGEFGYNTDGSTNNGPVADATRATYLTDAYDICRADGGVYALTWYSWQDGPAAWDIDGLATETAFIAYPMAATTVVGSASLSLGTPLLTALGLRTVLGSALLDSSSQLTAAGQRTVLGAAQLATEVLLEVLGEGSTPAPTIFGSASLPVGDPQLTAQGVRTVIGAAELTSLVTLDAQGQRTVLGTAALSSEGVLVAVGRGFSDAVLVGVFDLADGTLIASFCMPARSIDFEDGIRSLSVD